MARDYFPDGRFHGDVGHLHPYDLRYDPADAAHCHLDGEGRVVMRVTTEPGFAEAAVVLADGSGIAMECWGRNDRFAYWQASYQPPSHLFRYTFAFRDGGGRAVYLVPAGVANAVERIDRWTFDAGRARRVDVPDWAQGAVIYQIFPERFASGDDALTPAGADPWGADPHWLRFQGGDLAGIAERAGYLAGLGVDAVYLNPIFTAPSTHRYDTADYYQVDPALGGNEALAALVDALHAHDVRLVLDASFNHCSPAFFAFADVLENGEASEYAGWFRVNDWPPRVRLRSVPGHWSQGDAYREYLATLPGAGLAVEEADGPGPAVETTYEAWYGVPTLPRIDLSHHGARRYFLDVAAHWLREFDIDGWRMDVARYADFDFWPEFRDACRAVKTDSYLLAEVMGDAGPWLQGDAFDATMNYTFRELCLDYFATRTSSTAEFTAGFQAMLARYAPAVNAANQNLLSSHDKPRFRHLAGEDRAALAAATIFQMTAPGAPGLYYGDEVGMTGGEEPASRGAFPWHDEASWDRQQLTLVRELGALRRAHPALRHGDWRPVPRDDDLLAYRRSAGTTTLQVTVNRGPAVQEVGPAGAVVWGAGFHAGALAPGGALVTAG